MDDVARDPRLEEPDAPATPAADRTATHQLDAPRGAVPPFLVLGAWAFVRAAGGVLLLFIIASLIALLLNPFVSLLRRLRLPRGIAVMVVFLSLIVIVGGTIALLANPIANQVSAIQSDVP